MKFLLVLLSLGLVTLTAAQFNQGRFTPHRTIIIDDDDFDDFFDIDDDFDSLEDLYEDLYDDDADDRAEARAKLTRLRASGAITGSAFRNNRFLQNNRRNSGFRQGSFNSNRQFGFNTPRPAFNTPRPAFNTVRPTFNSQRPSFNTQRPSFNTQRPSFNTQRPSFNTQRPFFNAHQRPSSVRSSSTSTNTGFRSGFPRTSSFSSSNSLANNKNNNAVFSRPSTTSTKRAFGSSSSKFGSSSGSVSSSSPAFNTINTGSSLKTTSNSPFKLMPSGFTWPGGNGYFFSMSTNGAKPVTYFIRYDD